MDPYPTIAMIVVRYWVVIMVIMMMMTWIHHNEQNDRNEGHEIVVIINIHISYDDFSKICRCDQLLSSVLGPCC